MSVQRMSDDPDSAGSFANGPSLTGNSRFLTVTFLILINPYFCTDIRYIVKTTIT